MSELGVKHMASLFRQAEMPMPSHSVYGNSGTNVLRGEGDKPLTVQIHSEAPDYRVVRFALGRECIWPLYRDFEQLVEAATGLESMTSVLLNGGDVAARLNRQSRATAKAVTALKPTTFKTGTLTDITYSLLSPGEVDVLQEGLGKRLGEVDESKTIVDGLSAYVGLTASIKHVGKISAAVVALHGFTRDNKVFDILDKELRVEPLVDVSVNALRLKGQKSFEQANLRAMARGVSLREITGKLSPVQTGLPANGV